MGFHFSLDTVLRFRESVEQKEELALRQIQLEIAGLRRTIQDVTAAIAHAQKARDKAMRQTMPAAHLQAMVSEAEAAVERKKKLVASLEELEQQHAEQLKEWQAAHRKRQMLSDMEARQFDAYELEQVKAQQKRLDDLFGSRHQRG
jgi:flagellar export protein FliJ